MGYTRNAILIEAPVDEVFALTNDVRRWPTLFTEYESCEVIEEIAGKVTFRLTTHPDENGQVWSWIAHRQTNAEQRSTYSERMPSSGPFERMEIRWWYDPAGETSAIMTWEQEFTIKQGAPVTDQQATDYLNKQTKIQQQIIKERVEQIYQEAHKNDSDQANTDDYRGVIIGRYEPGSEEKIAEAFKRSDESDLPYLIGVKNRYIWVLGDIYIHLVEGKSSLPAVIKNYAQHPLFKEVKAEVDTYVHPISPAFNPGVGQEIYHWTNIQQKDA